MGITAGSWVDAQHAVLGDVLISGERLAGPLLSKTSEHDYSGPCLEVFKAIKRLHSNGRPCDPVSVANEVKASVSGDFIGQLMIITPTAANFYEHVSVLKEQSGVLAIHNVCEKIQEAETMDDIRPLVSEINRMQTRRSGAEIVSIQDAMLDFFQRMEETPEYIPMPIPELDQVVLAEFGDLMWLGAYSSCGKTAFALQWADLLSKKYKVGVFSLETRKEKLTDRFAAMKAAVALNTIKTRRFSNRDTEKLCSLAEPIGSQTLDFIIRTDLTVPDIEQISTENGYQIIFVDYIQIVKSTGRTEAEEIANAAEEMQHMAKRNKIFVVGLSQLTEDNMGNGYEPFNHSLRGSRVLEHTADIIFLMYLADKKKQKGNRILKVSKNKDGEPKKTELSFDGPLQTFRKAVTQGIDQTESDRRKLIAGASETGMTVSLCANCAKKMDDVYILTRLADRKSRDVDCFLCGNKLFGSDYILERRLSERIPQIEISGEDEKFPF